MFALCVVLLVVGVLAILLELLMPGADAFIAGIVGLLSLVASAILALIYVDGAWLLVGLNVAVLATAVAVFFTLMRRKQFHGKIVLSDALSEDLPAVDLESLVGKIGKTMTLLRPYGEAEFGGVRVEVCSDGTLVERGTNIKVKEVLQGKVIVSIVDGN
jgi:membrane-bound serine protease (ClpP class)